METALLEDRVQTGGVIVAELLQGCRSARERKPLQERLMALHYLEWGEEDWMTLGGTGSELRSKGVSVPLTDLIIALLALRHSSTILHRDRHFDLMARHLPLKLEKV